MAQHSNPARARQAATSIARTLRDNGHIAYFAGGCVRDELLGLRPTDYDVATDAPPRRVQSIFRKTASVGASFGVILVADFGPPVEVATFRAEGPYTDKRRPDHVTFATPEEDARRRDFTINALFLDPLAAGDSQSIRGHIVDLVGGLDDLKAGIIRAVGDPDSRLDEDHLRALRAVRFASRFNFAIEPGTRDAITRHARELAGVSRERIGDELRRMLSPGRDIGSIGVAPPPSVGPPPPPPPLAAVRLLEVLQLDTPALTPAKVCEAGGPTTGADPGSLAALTRALGEPVRSTAHPTLAGLLDDDVQGELLGGLVPDPLNPGISAMDVLAAWAIERYPVLTPSRARSDSPDRADGHGSDHADPTSTITHLAANWREALCLSNHERDHLVGVLTILHRLGRGVLERDDWKDRPTAARKRLAAESEFLPAVRILHACTRAGLYEHPAGGSAPARILANVRELAADGIGIAPPAVLTGDHLIQHGLKAGPHFKGLLAAVYDEQLEGRVRTIRDGLAFAGRLTR